MCAEIHDVGPGRKYIIGDAVTQLKALKESATVICLDDAWARPQRANQFGVTYPTHRFQEGETQDASDTSTTTTEILDACKTALEPGGWLIADADDWLLPRMIDYLIEDWGNVAGTYSGGGYRRIGGVTYLTKSTREPDRSTAGEYLTNGGYPVVFAHKGETNRKSSTSARQLAQRPQEGFGWGSVKPIDPYEAWVTALLDEKNLSEELLVVPCAGTAPAAIAAERAFGERIQYTCIDIEEGAYEAFKQRREHELGLGEQSKLGTEFD